MARMIPPTFSGRTTSPGEKQLFQRLKEDPNTSEWIVLHSLDIAHHIRQIKGEADFVVIVPNKGILCVEVKSHTHVQRDPTGYWYLGHDASPEQRGPFKQASEAMHSLRTRLFTQYPKFKNLLFWSCVIFTHTPFNVSSDEWHPWQVIDTNLFSSRPASFLLENILDEARNFLTTCTTATWFKPNLNIPSPAGCLEIAQALRPSFEFFESPESRERHLQQELKEYTEEQFLALERMAANPRVIFEGPAGTGKTLLAVEAARRATESGLKVLLLCYNSLLGGWLEKQTLSLTPQLTTRTLHKHMLRVWGGSVPEKPTRVFWEEELPARALSSLKNDSSSNHHYDLIIVDEAQDILRETYLRFLDKTLNNGLSKGKWLFFGDFEKQAIYSAATLHINDFREHWGNYAPVYSLRENCRNTPNVAEYVHLLGGLSPRYSKILRPNSDYEPLLKFYQDAEGAKNLLIECLKDLEKEKFVPSEIVILSPGNVPSSASLIVSSPWHERLRPYLSRKDNSISYCSIQSFKGLEAPVVIVTDIERVADNEAMALFYVAITRAVHRLIILANKAAKKDIINILTGGKNN